MRIRLIGLTASIALGFALLSLLAYSLFSGKGRRRRRRASAA